MEFRCLPSDRVLGNSRFALFAFRKVKDDVQNWGFCKRPGRLQNGMIRMKIA